ncbi:unnamed protein product, partial [Rotaria sp. Silwood1]
MDLALFYGGLIQFLAVLFELRLGNNFHALMFCSYAGYWFGLRTIYASTFYFLSSVTDTSVQYKALVFTAAITWYVGFGSLMIKGDNVCFNLPVFVLSPQSRIVANGESTAEVHAQKN